MLKIEGKMRFRMINYHKGLDTWRSNWILEGRRNN